MTKKSKGGISQKEQRSLAYSHAYERVEPDINEGRQTRRRPGKQKPSRRADSPPFIPPETRSPRHRSRPCTTPATPTTHSQLTAADRLQLTPMKTRSSQRTATKHQNQIKQANSPSRRRPRTPSPSPPPSSESESDIDESDEEDLPILRNQGAAAKKPGPPPASSANTRQQSH
jgi:hypothetical protein